MCRLGGDQRMGEGYDTPCGHELASDNDFIKYIAAHSREMVLTALAMPSAKAFSQIPHLT